MSYFLCNTTALQASLTKSTFTVYQYLAKSADNETRSCYKKEKPLQQNADYLIELSNERQKN